MAEIKSGLRNLLAHPLIYDSFQFVVGAYAWRARVIKDLVLPNLTPNSKVLDIGCGTCEVLKLLPPEIEYHGYDYNEAYIEYARKRFADRKATFECKSVDAESAQQPDRYQAILAFGLVHHLDDHQVTALIRNAKALLTPTGRLYLIDPVYCDQQSSLSKMVVSTDRGQNVRTLDGYLKLYQEEFTNVESHLDLAPLRIPYTGIAVSCSYAA